MDNYTVEQLTRDMYFSDVRVEGSGVVVDTDSSLENIVLPEYIGEGALIGRHTNVAEDTSTPVSLRPVFYFTALSEEEQQRNRGHRVLAEPYQGDNFANHAMIYRVENGLTREDARLQRTDGGTAKDVTGMTIATTDIAERLDARLQRETGDSYAAVSPNVFAGPTYHGDDGSVKPKMSEHTRVRMERFYEGIREELRKDAELKLRESHANGWDVQGAVIGPMAYVGRKVEEKRNLDRELNLDGEFFAPVLWLGDKRR